MTERRDWDVVIVGSGAGGGAVAAALAPLARAGLRVCVLERGPEVRADEVRPDEPAMAARLYDAGGGWLTADGAVSLALGRAVGGSTRVGTGVCVLPSVATLAGWRVPDLDVEDVVRRAQAAGDALGSRFLPMDVLNENTRFFVEGAERVGFAAQQVRVAVRGCRGAGTCHLGCPNGALQGTHVVHLAAARAAGVRVLPGVEVRRVAAGEVEVVPSGDGAALEAAWPWGAGAVTLSARHIVVCAGAVHTPALLLRSGLGRRLPRLGERFTCQPAQVFVAEHARPITNDVGHPTSHVVDRLADDGFLLEPCFLSPVVTAMHLTGFGAAHAALLHAYPRLQMLRAVARDAAVPGNRMTVDRRGRPVVRYAVTPVVRRALVRAQRAAARLCFGAGAVRVHAAAAAPPLLERRHLDELDERIAEQHQLAGRVSCTATHPMGGAGMGADARDSVTDAWGNVHGAPWLRVADASLCPDALGVPPMLTVLALAERVASRLAADLGHPAA